MKVPRLAVAVAIGAGAALLALALANVWLPGKLAGEVEERTQDWRMRSVPRRDRQTSPVVLVFFDSSAVRSWPYEVPFPRAAIAQVVDIVSGAGARAIGLDVHLERRYPELNRLDGGDDRLREAIRRAGNVVLATGTEQRGGERTVLPVDTFFASAAAAVGAADLPTPYETIRDATLTVQAGGRRVPGFATALWAVAQGRDADSLTAAAQREGGLRIPGLPARFGRVSTRRDAQNVPLLFLGPPSRTDVEEGAFQAFSSALLAELGELTPAEFFAGKIVLVGSGFHSSERFRTPFYDHRGPDGKLAGWTYGVEVHATALENLLAGRYPRPLPVWSRLLVVLALAGLVTAVTFSRGVAWGAATALGLALGYGGLSFLAFGSWQVELPLVAPALAALLSFVGATSYVSIVDGREKRMIRRAFSQYVPPAVVSQLVADPDRLRLGGEKRPVTLLFSDLSGFTTLSETADPQALVRFLNRYLDEMSRLVIQEGGTLDKFIGDGVMALYGAPGVLEDHALRACRTALAMHRRLAELNREWRGAGWGEVGMRIGINTGTPIVGNVGGRERFDYTALGDAVNLAARLEPACRTYGVGILVSGQTRGAAGDGIVARELELLGVRGRAEPVAVYELVALAGEDVGVMAEVMEHFAAGLRAFRDRDFELALVYFRQAAALRPEDGPSRLYIERCEAFIASPPPPEWSFVERRQVK